MTSSKKKAAPKQLVAVDARKLGQGLKTTFEGVAMVFDALGADADFSVAGEASVMEHTGKESETDAAEKTGHDAAAVAVSGDDDPSAEAAEVKPETAEPAEQADDDGADQEDAVDPAVTEATEVEVKEVESAEAEPVEDKPEPVKKPAPTSTVTQDDVTRVIVQKIKQVRSNNAKIGQILKTYGVSKVGELPASKYEAFLTDLAAL